ncbi:helix-turn-helix domain-containing protein [Desulfosporosinus sp. PR]|uniref:winged helix-turn-helix transcriptional regulator n=1 Tax=Candidatus Desulfosporosinus nitrosoreducens TaxID=3401928 RepID=UPI0027EC8379|nr:helix-turn-helix domain-containing protein [Desulfosporosinus sp. PR]MDQ7092147.1 helix-turn-helix domain-containing protein [Desulfosporosinus sp. PR]
MIKFRNNEYQCSMELTLALIGGKWKALILWHLGDKVLRYNEMRKMLPNVTPKMLTQQLRELEDSGLVKRFIYSQIPPKVEYSLTQAGKSLLPILDFLCKWGLNYANECEQTAQSKDSDLQSETAKTSDLETPAVLEAVHSD